MLLRQRVQAFMPLLIHSCEPTSRVKGLTDDRNRVEEGQAIAGYNPVERIPEERAVGLVGRDTE